jgi:hypothetical protein
VALIQQDPQDYSSTIDVPIRVVGFPSTQQIYSCQDWNGQSADACAKAVIANNNRVNVYLRNLVPNSVYLIAYSIANEYPISAIFSNNVETVEVQTSSSDIIVYSCYSLILILILLN